MEPIGWPQENQLLYFTIVCLAMENHSRPAIRSSVMGPQRREDLSFLSCYGPSIGIEVLTSCCDRMWPVADGDSMRHLLAARGPIQFAAAD